MLYLSVLFLLLATCDVHSDGQSKKSNIVLFLTDDQDIILDGMTPMQNVKHFIANQGITFNNAKLAMENNLVRGQAGYSHGYWSSNYSYTASPICCPSRASILTGMYPHNHGTRNNSIAGGCNGGLWKYHEQNTFATKLKENGYTTFYAGKYLNQYGVSEAGGPEVVPPGWSEWHGLVGNSVYYNYVLSNNGVPTHSDNLYLTDVIKELAVSFIESRTEEQPFLLVVSPPAPHAPFTPAARHLGAYANVTCKRTPNFNIKAEEKHWLLRMPPSPLPDSMVPELDRAFRSRWEALLAVDEMVSEVITTLADNGFLNDTYLLYTSDNGYHIGQFSQVYDKRQPYETDIKVPLVISGPGIEHNVTSSDPVLNIDLAPTILSLAGVEIPESMDGKPIELIKKEDKDMKERFILIEYYGERSPRTVDESCPWKYDDNLSECLLQYDCKCQDSKNNTFACARHIARNINFKYCFFRDQEHFEEMYDLNVDPFEMDNIIDTVFPALKHWYRLNVANMLECVGAQQCSYHL